MGYFTLIGVRASHKSIRSKGEEGGGSAGARPSKRDVYGERRRNDTDAATADPKARLFRTGSGKDAKLGFIGPVISENRSGLVVAKETTLATGAGEREVSVKMIKRVNRARCSTLERDKGYETQDQWEWLRTLGVTPHVAQNDRSRQSAIDARTTSHSGYATSQLKRSAWNKYLVGECRRPGPEDEASWRPTSLLDVPVLPGCVQPLEGEAIATLDVSARG